MKKLRLTPGELRVDSFHAEARADGGKPGTVRGFYRTEDPRACTAYGVECTTTAAPGEPCDCIMLSNPTCGSEWNCGCVTSLCG